MITDSLAHSIFQILESFYDEPDILVSQTGGSSFYPQGQQFAAFPTRTPTPDWHKWGCPALEQCLHTCGLFSFRLYSKNTSILRLLPFWDPSQKFTYSWIPKGLPVVLRASSFPNQSRRLSGWLDSQGLEARVPLNVQRPRPSTSCFFLGDEGPIILWPVLGNLCIWASCF